jgi:hypothetical protein
LTLINNYNESANIPESLFLSSDPSPKSDTQLWGVAAIPGAYMNSPSSGGLSDAGRNPLPLGPRNLTYPLFAERCFVYLEGAHILCVLGLSRTSKVTSVIALHPAG